MKVVHRMAVVAMCPKGGRDEYELEVELDAVVEVEKLIAMVDDATREPIYQENLCVAIAEELGKLPAYATDQYPAGIVRLRGVHSGVRTLVEEEFVR